MRAFTILVAAWFPPGRAAGSYSAWYTEERAPDSGLNVWPASPWPRIKRYKARGREGGRERSERSGLWNVQPVIVREKKSRRITIIKLGTISSRISMVILVKGKACSFRLKLFADVNLCVSEWVSLFKRCNCLRMWKGNEVTEPDCHRCRMTTFTHCNE